MRTPSRRPTIACGSRPSGFGTPSSFSPSCIRATRKAVVRRTVELQDVLGEYQDADVGIARLRELAGSRGEELGPETVFVMGEIAERYRSSMHAIRDQVPSTQARLTGKAWKRLLEAARRCAPPAATNRGDHPDRVTLLRRESPIVQDDLSRKDTHGLSDHFALDTLRRGASEARLPDQGRRQHRTEGDGARAGSALHDPSPRASTRCRRSSARCSSSTPPTWPWTVPESWCAGAGPRRRATTRS